MSLVILMRGTSGAGKSTWAAAHYPGALVISSDAYLTDAEGVWHWEPERLPAIHGQMLRDLSMALRAEEPVIVVDRCHITMSAMGPTLRLARAKGASIRVVTLQVDPLRAWERSKHGAPARVVAEMAAKLQRESRRIPRWVEHIRLRDGEPIEAPQSKGLIVVADVDKTLGPGGDAAPYRGAVELLRALASPVFYITARGAKRRRETEAWLSRYGFPRGPVVTCSSGAPIVVRREKGASIGSAMRAHPAASVVLFGDNAHRDPEVYASVERAHPDRVRAVFIRDVKGDAARFWADCARDLNLPTDSEKPRRR